MSDALSRLVNGPNGIATPVNEAEQKEWAAKVQAEPANKEMYVRQQKAKAAKAIKKAKSKVRELSEIYSDMERTNPNHDSVMPDVIEEFFDADGEQRKWILNCHKEFGCNSKAEFTAVMEQMNRVMEESVGEKPFYLRKENSRKRSKMTKAQQKQRQAEHHKAHEEWLKRFEPLVKAGRELASAILAWEDEKSKPTDWVTPEPKNGRFFNSRWRPASPVRISSISLKRDKNDKVVAIQIWNDYAINKAKKTIAVKDGDLFRLAIAFDSIDYAMGDAEMNTGLGIHRKGGQIIEIETSCIERIPGIRLDLVTGIADAA